MAVFTFTREDHQGFCTCETCSAVEEEFNGSHAALYMFFVNDLDALIQEWIKVNQPGRDITVLFFAYSATASAPVVTTGAPVVEAAKTVAPKAVAPANGEKVISPFPGLIKNLLVAEGATVKEGQPILVLEAMKMDNDIVAVCNGVVHFQVVKGANVESDAVLAVIS